jgi:hypothetical protein
MSFRANVLKVMIASPGDVSEERRIVTEEIYRWNDANASARHLVLLPVKWETHSTPQMGGPPQTIISRQILDDADIVVGIFGTRIGTPTEKHVSGTVEEIKEHVAAGKTAKVYFSDVPVSPSELVAEQYESVKKFREECQSMGLFATFRSVDDFRRDFSQHLAIELNQGRYLWLATPAEDEEEDAIQVTADELRLLQAAAVDDGVIVCDEALNSYGVRAGEEEFSDGTARTHARWRDTIQRFEATGILEHISGALYRLTDSGYQIAEKPQAPDENAKKAFSNIQETHTRSLVESLAWMQRDMLRFLLLKGGSAKNNVISPALSNPTGGIDFNSLTQPLIQDGFLERSDDLTSGYSDFSIKSELRGLLQRILFPRREEKPPYFNGIP